MNKKTPLVSVIIPVYNAQNHLNACIDSVLAQTFVDYEIVIINDHSTDNSPQIIQALAQEYPEKIKSLTNQNPKGVAGTRNTGLAVAAGRFVAFLDADDRWQPQKLAMQIDFMQKNDVAFSFTSYQATTPTGTPVGKIIAAPARIGYHDYLKNTIIGCLTVMIDTQKTGKITMPYLRTSQDMALWLELMKRGFVAHGIAQPLALYRQSAGSITANKWQAAADVWVVYRQVEQLSFLYSAMCLVGYAYNAIKKRL
jgi:teichuronic acid biosynthesis glycosyltransferase TuaG